MIHYLRLYVVTLLILAVIVAAYLGGYRFGRLAGYDTGYAAAREKFSPTPSSRAQGSPSP